MTLAKVVLVGFALVCGLAGAVKGTARRDGGEEVDFSKVVKVSTCSTGDIAPPPPLPHGRAVLNTAAGSRPLRIPPNERFGRYAADHEHARCTQAACLAGTGAIGDD